MVVKWSRVGKIRQSVQRGMGQTTVIAFADSQVVIDICCSGWKSEAPTVRKHRGGHRAAVKPASAEEVALYYFYVSSLSITVTLPPTAHPNLELEGAVYGGSSANLEPARPIRLEGSGLCYSRLPTYNNP